VLGVLLLAAIPTEKAYSQEAGSVEALARVQSALQSGSVNGLMETATSRVEISLFGSGAQYSRAQAAFVLQDFFRQFPPERVDFVERSMAETSRTAMGSYWVAGQPDPLGVYVRLRFVGGEWRLAAVRMERVGTD